MAAAETTAMGVAAHPTTVVTREPQEDELEALALRFGLALVPIDNSRKEIAQAIASRMRPRSGKLPSIYQAAAFSISSIPRAAACTIFPAALITTDTAKVVTWKAATEPDVAALLGSLLSEHTTKLCAGVSRAMKTPAESAIHSISTLLAPLEISWVQQARGVMRLYINLMYVLSDSAGEVHPPKDANRREVAIEATAMAALRAQVLTDVAQMAAWGFPLAEGYFAQIPTFSAEEAAAAAAAAQLKPRWRQPRPRKPRPRKRRQRAAESSEEESSEEESSEEEASSSEEEEETFVVEEIVHEMRDAKGKKWWIVRWTGYDPAWETYRQQLIPGRSPGQPGEPVETWADWEDLKHTEAMAAWKAARRAAKEA